MDSRRGSSGTPQQPDGYEVRYEPSPEESLAVCIVDIISNLAGRPPDELDVLHDVVDPDALDILFSSLEGRSRDSGHVTFPSEGFDVTVMADREIIIQTT